MPSLKPPAPLLVCALCVLALHSACSDDGMAPDGGGLDAAVRDGGSADGSDGAVGDASPDLCGNSSVDVGEECDGADLQGQDCASLGFEGGALSCARCGFDVSACASALSVVVAVNQESCEAPCTVFFDATGTTGLSDDYVVASTFLWDFDPTGIEPAERHRSTVGFVVAHTFASAGSYDVRVNVRDTNGRAGSAVQRITITAPVTPLYVASTGSDAAPGTTTEPLASIEAAFARRAAAQPVVLRRGDVFTLGSLNLGDESDLLLGAYTDPASPSAEKPRVVLTTDGVAITLDRTTDARVEGIHFVAEAASTGISLADSLRATILGVDLEGIRSAESISIYNFTAESVAVVDTHLFNFDGYGVFGGGRQQAVIGCRIVDFGGNQHGVRINGGEHFYLAENFIGGRPDSMTSYTIRGAGTGSTMTNVVIVGNHSIRPTSVSPQNFEEDERASNVLVEGNTYEGGLGLTAQNVVVRNNRFLQSGLSIDTRHPLLPEGFLRDYVVEHNAAHIDSTDETSFILVGGRARSVTIRNNVYGTTSPVTYSRFILSEAPLSELTLGINLVHMPNIPSPEPYWVVDRSYSAAEWTSATGADSLTADPGFLSVEPSSADALVVGPGSTCIDAAEESTTALDAQRTRRPLDGDGDGTPSPDLGPFERPAI